MRMPRPMSWLALMALTLADCACFAHRLWDQLPERTSPVTILGASWPESAVLELRIRYDNQEIYHLRQRLGERGTEIEADSCLSPSKEPVQVLTHQELATWRPEDGVAVALDNDFLRIRDARLVLQMRSFDVPRPITWVHPQTLLTIVSTPLTIALDIVTLPFQVVVILLGGHFD